MKKVLFINFLVFITILFLIEFFIRVSFDITPQGISKGIRDESKNPIFNFPNISSKKVFGKKVYTDENGFRVSDNFIKKDDTLEEIFFVGGSVTFGSGVTQSNTFSGILEKKLSYSITEKVEKVEVYREKYDLVAFLWEKVLSTEESINDGEMGLIRKWIRRLDISDVESEGARKDAMALLNPSS